VKILASGGGTGGHLFPALAVLEEFQKRHEAEIAYVTVAGKIDERIISRDHPSYKRIRIRTRGLYRPLYNPKNIKRFVQYFHEMRKIRKFARKFQPDFVFLTGGYASGIVAMALKDRYPMFIHEQNVIPGIANVYSSKYARKIFVSFENTKRYFPESTRFKIEVVGNPIRDVFYTKSVQNIPDGLVLVMGGSLGSADINSLMERVYEIDSENVYYHATGSSLWTERLRRFRNVYPKDFYECTPILWRKAKFVIARAGGTTVYEMIRYKVRGILIPWKGSTESHQIENAEVAKSVGLAEVMEDPDPIEVVERINKSLYNPNRRFSSPAAEIYNMIMEAIG
jgi:UDP-N-acetylglucosamine--N-acetylmuramyl-(pentapeptide) pyrophosphoryl-undecaprenol N-acetylglucosamine transferase